MAQGAGAIVLVTASPSARFMSNVDKNGIHAVAIDMKSNPPAHVPTLSAANFTGAYEATSHLVELGHRRIAFVGNSTQFDYARERFAGYRSALEAAHLVMEPELVFQGEPEFTPGLVAGRDIAAMHNRPTAVFCVSDPVAFGVIEGAREAGLRVPEDLSVVGFDDIEPANWSSPQLTTVRQPIYEMGRTSVSIAYKLLTGEPVHSVHTQLATTLVVRGSTATVRG
jgi:LacI family transcriptional regulator